MTARAVALLTMCLLSTPAAARVDLYGNIMPPECDDLSAVNAPVHELTREEAIEFLKDKPAIATHRITHGIWWDHQIYIAAGMPEPLRSYAITHEECHEAFARAHDGNPHWH